MAKKKKRKRARSRKSNPSTKKTRRRKKRRNPVASASPKRRRGKRRSGSHFSRTGRRNRRNPAKRKGKRRKSRKNPEGVLLDIAKALGVGLGAAAIAGIGTFVVGQKVSKGTNLVSQNTLHMIQGGMIALGIGGAYLLATKAKSPLLAAAAAAGTIAGVAGPPIVSAGVKAIATQQDPGAAAAAKGTTQNGLGALELAERQRMNGLSLRQPGMSGVFDEGASFG